MADAGAAGYVASVADFRSAQAFLIRGLQIQGDSISAAFAIDKSKTWVDLRRRDWSSLRLGKADYAEPVSGQGRDFLKNTSVVSWTSSPASYFSYGLLSLRVIPKVIAPAGYAGNTAAGTRRRDLSRHRSASESCENTLLQ